MPKPFEHVPPQRAPAPGRIAFVGEAPSDSEVWKGAPLVGPSGQIFNMALRIAGIDRDEHMVTNVFDTQLPDNSVEDWLAPKAEAAAGGFDDLPPLGPAGRGGYLRPEYRGHLARLRAELEEARPNVIVPLGGTALWAFTGDPGISARRGAVQRADYLVPGAKLVPSFHPAMVIRDWNMFPVMVGDFEKAAREALRGPQIEYVRRELWLEPSLDDMREFSRHVEASQLLSVDIETGWGQMTSFGIAPDSRLAICVPFLDLRQPDKSYWRSAEEEAEALRIIKGWCENGVPKLGQFAGTYDAYWLSERYGIGLRNYREDTRLMHHAIYPELPKDLQFLGARYTDLGPWKILGRHAEDKRDG